MSTQRLGRILILVAGLGVIGSGCQSEKKEQSEPSQVVPQAAAPMPAPAMLAPVQEAAPGGAAAVQVNPDGTVTVNIESVGETMAFNVNEITVPAGKKITVNLKNNATSDVMKHNFVLVQNGKADEIGIAAVQAGEAKGYLPDNPAILAHSSMSGPGQTVSVTFDAPLPGEYQFVCTFPGHYMLMRGRFIVKAEG